MNDREIFNTIVVTLGVDFTYVGVGWDTCLIVLVLFMSIDYITGLIAATIKQNLNSHIGFNGILRKSTILLVLIVTVLLDRLINQSTWVFRTVVAYFYIGNEGIIILENCGKCGIPLPKRLMKALEQLKKKEEI